MFLDATYIPLRRGTVEREAVNVAIGIRSDGGKEVLDYSIAPTENGAAWSELLQGLRARGIKGSSPKCWCKLNSANLSFHKLKHTGFF